jgi:preprotein translocase subunit Sss1
MENYVTNPYTGRLIKKGSKVYKRLLNAKLLDEEKPSTPQENKILEADTPAQAKELQGKMNKNMQKNKIVTRRGNQVLKAARRPTQEETINKVTDIAVESIREHKDQMQEREMTNDEMDTYIRKMIANKLVGNPSKKITSRYEEPSLQNRLKMKQQEYDLDSELELSEGELESNFV